MGAGGSVPEVPASGLGVDVPTFKKLRKAYESKKDGMSDEELLDYLKNQHQMLVAVSGASGGAIEFPEGMGPSSKRASQRQSTFLQDHGGSFARKSKLSIIQGDIKGSGTRPSFNQGSLVVPPESQISRPRKPSLSTSDEQYLTPGIVKEDKEAVDRNKVSFSKDTSFDEDAEDGFDESDPLSQFVKPGQETKADREERKAKLRQRQATGFIKPKPASPSKITFAVEEEKKSESKDCGGGSEEGKESEADRKERQAKVRARQATGFVKPGAAAAESKGTRISFDDGSGSTSEDKEGEESDADRAERMAKIRNRQPTSFIPNGASADGTHVQFSESQSARDGNEEGGGETDADKAERRAKLRNRQPTQIVRKGSSS